MASKSDPAIVTNIEQKPPVSLVYCLTFIIYNIDINIRIIFDENQSLEIWPTGNFSNLI